MFVFDKGREITAGKRIFSPKDKLRSRRHWLNRLIPGAVYLRAMTRRLVVDLAELKGVSICMADTLEVREKAFQHDACCLRRSGHCYRNPRGF
ncbi:hypothetical protein [Burkholderia sp. SRS-W-2-2016]|uniref:hypothetical protein n=1 Tax=Burkholderia sp. SRS-W-2-2016 TaxID=1926878 RepID=UPI00117FABC3|nr:hypothetical protein [Burkholderia sp. SRS-W-2-2016]